MLAGPEYPQGLSFCESLLTRVAAIIIPFADQSSVLASDRFWDAQIPVPHSRRLQNPELTLIGQPFSETYVLAHYLVIDHHIEKLTQAGAVPRAARCIGPFAGATFATARGTDSATRLE
jgi:hypothetical protein